MSNECHVLIAEDEEQILGTMSLVLQGMGCQVSTANSGVQALKVLEKERTGTSPVDVLITDIQMPEMTGEELIRQVRLLEPDLPVLVMTGFGTKELLVQLMRYGCQDYLDKPFRKAEFVNRVSPLLEKAQQRKNQSPTMTSNYADDYKNAFRELRERFNMAAQAVHTILKFDPDQAPFDVGFCQQALSDLGGDYVGMRQNGNGWDVLLVDVAGHDMAATMYALLVKTYFEENARQGRSGSDLMKALNTALCQNQFLDDIPPRQASAIFLHLEGSRVEMINCGHPPAILTRGSELQPLAPDAPLLGMFPDEEFKPSVLPTIPGDRLILYTDGLLNAARVDGPTGKRQVLSYNGVDRLIKQSLTGGLQPMVQAIWQGVVEFCRYRIEDDLTLLALEIPKE